MKILYLTNIPSPYRVDFFNELGKYCELTVLYVRDKANDRDEKWEYDNNIRYKKILLRGLKIRNDDAFCPSVIKYLKHNFYDVIVVGTYSSSTAMLAIDFMKLHKIPFVLNCDGGFSKKDSKIKFKIKKHYISAAKAWLSTGNKTNQYLHYYGAKKEGIFIYPFASQFQYEQLINVISENEKKLIRNDIDIKENRVLITVGQFIYRKGFDLLLESARHITHDVGIYIIGGEASIEANSFVKEYGLENVHFVGFKTKEELSRYYKAADLFVLPTREDIWGLVINEAMGYALPIITTNRCIAGLELVRNDINGYIIPINDVTKLSNKITELLINDELRKSMSDESLEIIRKYTIENMALKHIEIFRDYIESGETSI